MQKVLINAYAVRPNFGSEAGAAWQWITRLSPHYELFVITEGEWSESIELEKAKLPNKDSVHFYYNPVSEEIRNMCWNQGDYRFYYYYAKWQKKTLEIAQEIVNHHHIDLIHQLNMIGFREPGYLWKIKNIPFVWGPIGGMIMAPMQYMEDAPLYLKTKYWLKNNISRLQYRYQPRVQKIIRRADALIASNKTTYDTLTKRHPEKYVVLINETGSNDEGTVQRKVNNAEAFNILWVGRFIPTKLLKLSLEVISILKDLPGLKFHIVGQAFDDKETERYHKLAHEKGLDDVCEWHGWVSHDEVQNLMQQSDIFFFPSVVEGTPHVVLESIANGLPVVCFDECGQGEAVDDSIGRKIPFSTPIESINSFAEIIKSLYNDRELLASLSAGCENRKQQLSWKKKIEAALVIYDRVLNSTASDNDIGFVSK